MKKVNCNISSIQKEIDRLKGNIEYLSMLKKSLIQLQNGEVVHKSLKELEAMI